MMDNATEKRFSRRRCLMAKHDHITQFGGNFLKGVFIIGMLLICICVVMGPIEIHAQGNPQRTSPPISCAGCHDFQAKLFKDYPSHHPNNLTLNLQTDIWTKAKTIREDCKACHLFDPQRHTRGVVLLKDPDPGDTFSYNGDLMNKKNLCLSCHDKPKDPTKPVMYFSVGNYPQEIASKWVASAHGTSTIPNTQILIDCLDCHKYHGSAFSGLRKLVDEDLCYTCHDDKQKEFDPGFTSHHHLEPIFLDMQFQDVLDCTDCHNPHIITLQRPITRPSLPTELYQILPTGVATATITNTSTGLLVSGTPYYTGQINDVSTPLNNLFCMECHAPNLFTETRPAWPGAPNISYELTNKNQASPGTVSNFYFAHNHFETKPCDDCHTTGGGGGGGGGGGSTTTIINFTFNGHYTHKDNASCTYCHDPHGTKGTYTGPTESVITGVQRGHLLKSWLLADSRYASPVPAYGGYKALQNGAVSCLANDPLNSCHDVTFIHESTVKPLLTDNSCNTTKCHDTFVAVLGRINEDRVAPEPPG
jgi:predicted CXXCH cytochrome family protein